MVDHIDHQVIQDNPELVSVDLVEDDIDQRTHCHLVLVGQAIGHLNTRSSTV